MGTPVEFQRRGFCLVPRTRQQQYYVIGLRRLFEKRRATGQDASSHVLTRARRKRRVVYARSYRLFLRLFCSVSVGDRIRYVRKAVAHIVTNPYSRATRVSDDFFFNKRINYPSYFQYLYPCDRCRVPWSGGNHKNHLPPPMRARAVVSVE